MAGAKRRPGILVAIAAVPALFVILGRSKERSDAAQTLGSMPLLLRSAAVQNRALCAKPRTDVLDRLHASAEVTELILGSALRFASLRPRMTKAWGPRPHSSSLPSIIIAVPCP
ncbi:hypothetical protein FJW06_10660 [Mesorhizobium sp. B4-1-3]|nr:hypothetical protein FJW06_10660 [Mesorhizobium sp. B4-1-3]